MLSLSTSHSFPLIEVAHYLHSNSALRRAGAGAARRAAVRRALALERDHRARAAALQRRQEGRAAAAAHEVRGPAGDGVPGPGRLRREPRRRARGARPSAGRADPATTACTRRWTPTAGSRCCAAWRAGEVEVVARDLTAPSPFAAEALNARPYAFLDDAPLEERRTQAVLSRRYAEADSAGRPRPARPGGDRRGARGGLAGGAQRRRDARGADGPGLRHATQEAQRQRRLDRIAAAAGEATHARDTRRGRRRASGVAAERLPQAQALYPRCDALQPPIAGAGGIRREAWTREDALRRTAARAPDRPRSDRRRRRSPQPLALPHADIDAGAAARWRARAT